ncbi:MAG: nucleotidyltransferase domain-containing protein [Deltaproteobacteria bacterium]|nr:nucleotidyltransferase domain-containing protein [Deltaproteobacteria bacterium]
MGKLDQIRLLIAKEAARLMYEEGVREYRDAKRKAARRFGPAKGLALGEYLPSNAEIHQELQHLIRFFEGEEQPERAFQMRLLALKYMDLLKPFRPYLVGSVLSGAVTSRSDIDLHLFADTAEEVEDHLKQMGIPFDSEVVTVRKGGEFLDYPHIYLEEDEVEIECSIYPPEDIRRIPKSSITGRPMERADMDKLRKIISEMMKV